MMADEKRLFIQQKPPHASQQASASVFAFLSLTQLTSWTPADLAQSTNSRHFHSGNPSKPNSKKIQDSLQVIQPWAKLEITYTVVQSECNRTQTPVFQSYNMPVLDDFCNVAGRTNVGKCKHERDEETQRNKQNTSNALLLDMVDVLSDEFYLFLQTPARLLRCHCCRTD